MSSYNASRSLGKYLHKLFLFSMSTWINVVAMLSYNQVGLSRISIFQEDKDLVHEFVQNDGLACLIKVSSEADQNYQNYILRGEYSIHHKIEV